MPIYRTVQTGPNSQLGGAQLGRMRVEYQLKALSMDSVYKTTSGVAHPKLHIGIELES